uniref:Uncharacterized protein n=1 Tax=viral metagenome TaxID=1070528 RepID=A0A6M3LSI9_9ZZZZ
MKSVTIKQNGEVLIKIIHRKNGVIDLIKRPDLAKLEIDVRDDRNYKIQFGPHIEERTS